MKPIELLPEYKPLFYNPPATRYALITGGRASAKSFHVALAILNLTYEKDQVILYSRYTMTSAHDSIIPEFQQKIDLLGVHADFEVNKADIINKRTGSRIMFRGIKTSSGNQTAKLKSIQGLSTFVLEEAEEERDGTDFETIDDSVRTVGVPNRVWVVMNPSFKTHYFYKEFIEPNRSDVTHIHTDYRINVKNLSPSILEKIERMRKVNPARYAHAYLGEWLDESEGLLWNREIINSGRLEPEHLNRAMLRRVILAIDPAVTKTAQSDETGMVVVGVDAKNEVYILDDVSGHYSPQEWARVAKDTADHWNIDAYVAEGNQGHDLVDANLRSVDPNRRVKMVRATRGKTVRAEPVYGLYERGTVHHVGFFPKLEAQMVSWNPEQGIGSPDRVDALVWGVTDLIFSNTAPAQSKMRGKPKSVARRL